MIDYLHTRTVAHSLKAITLKDGTPILDVAFSMLSKKQVHDWKMNVEDVFLQIEDEYGLKTSQKSNAEYLIGKLQLSKPSGLMFAWQYMELDRLYTRHLSKLSKMKADHCEKIKEKAQKELDYGFEPTLENELNLLLKNRLDRYALKEGQREALGPFFHYKRFIQSSKGVFVLDVIELTHAIKSVIDILESVEKTESPLKSVLKNALNLLVYVKANIDLHTPIPHKNYYWAVMSIKLMSVIKMYFIDPNTGKRTFFGNGYKQDCLDSLVAKILTKTSKSDIEKLSIDEKLEHVYASISDILKIKEASEPPQKLLDDKSTNPKYVGLIFLHKLCRELEESKVEWVGEFRKLYESLYSKYMMHPINRAEKVNKTFSTPLSTRYHHKYMDGCIECHQIS